MQETILMLTYIAVLLLVGILCSFISKKIRISNILLLILAGIAINKIRYLGKPLIQFPVLFLTTVSMIALVMIVFDAASRFKFKEFDTLSSRAFLLVIIFLLFNLIFLTTATRFIFGIRNIFLLLLFSALVSGTDPATVLAMFKSSKNKIIEVLELESIINTPLTVLLPFIIIELMVSLQEKISLSKFDILFEQLSPFLLKFIAGIGAGVLMGLIVSRLMRRWYAESVSPLALLTSALLTFILAENLGGNGVIAVTIMGLFFGNIYIKHKSHLHEFSAMFANSFEIFVFILIGLAINIPLTLNFFIKSMILFIIYLLIRFFVVMMCFKKFKYLLKEKIFMALNVQKGIAVAVIIFALTTFNIEGINIILNLALAFMIYSVALSTVVSKFSKKFLSITIKEE
ncbi:MAG: cation:proton antiporter [Nanoarchaeota archaeon]|nr:cation:proton antiporter [Nanoarchaeota archaeon]